MEENHRSIKGYRKLTQGQASWAMTQYKLIVTTEPKPWVMISKCLLTIAHHEKKISSLVQSVVRPALVDGQRTGCNVP